MRENAKGTQDALSGGAAAIYLQQDQTIEIAEFWEWMRESYPHARFPVDPSKVKGTLALIQGKGAEWTTYLEHHPTLFELNSLPTDSTAPLADVTSGSVPIQVKTAFFSPSRVSKEMFLKYPEHVKFVANESVYEAALRHGVPEDRFVKVLSDAEVKKFGLDRLRELQTGKINIGITFEVAIHQAMNGAAIGAIAGGAISFGVSLYRWRRGEITGKDVGMESLIGALHGGSIGGIAAITSVAAKSIMIGIGMSTLWALPLTFAAGVAAGKVIDFASLFKRGDYKYALCEVEVTKALCDRLVDLHGQMRMLDLQNRWLEFRQRKARALITLAEQARNLTNLNLT